jgi:hypothetical protein
MTIQPMGKRPNVAPKSSDIPAVLPGILKMKRAMSRATSTEMAAA